MRGNLVLYSMGKGGGLKATEGEVYLLYIVNDIIVKTGEEKKPPL